MPLGYAESMQNSVTVRRTLLLLALLTARPAAACNIPVFRYALERWQSDALDVYLFHDRALSSGDAEFVAAVETASTENGGHANLRVIRIKPKRLDGAPKEASEVWRSLAAKRNVALPYLAVATRLGDGRRIYNWHGRLAEARTASLLDSPVRQELRKRLVAGHAVVWLMLKSADASRNAAAHLVLEPALAQLAKKIELPEGVGLPGSELYSETPLLLKFSILEVDPDDPHEQYLVRLLAGVQPEAFAKGEPLLAPVFGRGRMLEVIALNKLEESLIDDLTTFLSGACSCQVKELNPGFDMLLENDWQRQLFGDDGLRPPAISVTEDAALANPVYLTLPPGKKAQRP